MKTWGALAALMIVVGAALMGGCGGSDDETTSLTKAEFIARGDVICTKANAQKNKDLEVAFAELQKRPTAGGKAAEEKLISDVALPAVKKMSEELTALGVPDSGTAQAEEFLTGLEATVAKVEGNPALALSGGDVFEKVKVTAKDFGFKACQEF